MVQISSFVGDFIRHHSVYVCFLLFSSTTTLFFYYCLLYINYLFHSTHYTPFSPHRYFIFSTTLLFHPFLFNKGTFSLLFHYHTLPHFTFPLTFPLLDIILFPLSFYPGLLNIFYNFTFSLFYSFCLWLFPLPYFFHFLFEFPPLYFFPLPVLFPPLCFFR